MIVKLVQKQFRFERVYECITYHSYGLTQWALVLPSGAVTFYAKSRWDLYKYTKEGFEKDEQTL